MDIVKSYNIKSSEIIGVSKHDIIESLQYLGLRKGDSVIVHSSYKSLGHVYGGPKTIIEAFLDAIGKNGLLIMPTFNFDFCIGTPYDKNNTPSHMGIITELARKDPRSYSVYHPIYSFALIGKNAEELSNTDNMSSFGPNSFFAKMHEMNTKIIAIGLPYQKSFTFIHYVEQCAKCEYRFVKRFSGQMIEKDGTVHDIVCDMNVRNIDAGVDTYIEPMGKVLEDSGVIKTGYIKDTVVKISSAVDFFEATKDMPTKRPHLLRRIVETPRIHNEIQYGGDK